jgi:hypothetical protein
MGRLKHRPNDNIKMDLRERGSFLFEMALNKIQ